MVAPPRGGRQGGSRWWCAEHNGDIARFADLEVKLDDLADWNDFFRRDTLNMAAVTKTALVAVSLATTAIPVGILVAPALAARLGALGLLGTASTGTAIQSLSGAALTSASLAYIGGGAIAAGGGGAVLGTGVIVAVGAALAGRVGGGVAHAYFRQVDGYAVRKLRNAARGIWRHRNTVVFVNGWLQQDDTEFADWLQGTESHFGKASAYGVIWESGRPVKAFVEAPARVTAAALSTAATALARALGLSLPAAEALCKIIANPWHVAFHKSGQVGALNAEMLARYTGPPVTLMGHSLGARTILFTLLNLANRPGKPIIRDVYLFGGAADSSRKNWERAAQAVGRHAVQLPLEP